MLGLAAESCTGAPVATIEYGVFAGADDVYTRKYHVPEAADEIRICGLDVDLPV